MDRIESTHNRTAAQLADMPNAAHGVRLAGIRASAVHIVRADLGDGGQVHVRATMTGPAVETNRQSTAYGFASLDWLARVCAPAWLDACGLSDMARIVRDLAPLTDGNAARAAGETLRAAQRAAYRGAGIVVCAEVGRDVLDVVDASGAGMANGATFHAVGRSHTHPDADVVGAAASYAYAVCQYAAHATAERKRAGVAERVAASGVPQPQPATAGELVEATRREFGARRVEYGEPVPGAAAARVGLWFDSGDVVTVARPLPPEASFTPADLAAGVRPRIWDGVQVCCDDTTGARVAARFVVEGVDRLGCGCWRLRGRRPGPCLPGLPVGMEVLTGCAVHPCGILPARVQTEPVAEVVAKPVNAFADLLATRR